MHPQYQLVWFAHSMQCFQQKIFLNMSPLPRVPTPLQLLTSCLYNRTQLHLHSLLNFLHACILEEQVELVCFSTNRSACLISVITVIVWVHVTTIIKPNHIETWICTFSPSKIGQKFLIPIISSGHDGFTRSTNPIYCPRTKGLNFWKPDSIELFALLYIYMVVMKISLSFRFAFGSLLNIKYLSMMDWKQLSHHSKIMDRNFPMFCDFYFLYFVVFPTSFISPYQNPVTKLHFFNFLKYFS